MATPQKMSDRPAREVDHLFKDAKGKRLAPASNNVTVPIIVKIVVRPKIRETRAMPPRPAVLQADNISGIRDSHGPKMKITNNTQGVIREALSL